MQGLRIVVADDHTLLRQVLVQLLERNGAEVVGQAATGDAAVLLARKLSPAVVVMDVRMPGGMSGIEATARLRQTLPACRVVGFSMDHDPRTGEKMRAAGASAYVSKSDPPDVLLEAIHGNTRRSKPWSRNHSNISSRRNAR